MSETKRYYLGTGTEFIKAQCKEYKTLDNALKAAAKDESLVVWDEDGNIIGSLTDNVPEGTIIEGADEQNNTADDAEQGENGEKDIEGTDESPASDNGVNEANTEPEEKDSEDEEHPEEDELSAAGITAEETGKFNIKVICEGSLRLRRSPSFITDNECGRASKGQTYIGKRIFMVDGLPMVETIDGLFLSAASEHVRIEEGK